MPARCWIAPEIPTATYSCGETVLPVCPTWNSCGYQPASVDRPGRADRRAEGVGELLDDLEAVRRAGAPPAGDHDLRLGQLRPRALLRRHPLGNPRPLGRAGRGERHGSTAAAPGDASALIAFGRTAMIGVPARTVECTVIEPPKFACAATGAPSAPA